MNQPFEIDVDTLGNLRPIAKVVFSLGSNEGDSEATLQGAVDLLNETPDLILVDVSPVYQTEPVGDVEQADFLNMVVVAESTLEPMTLLDRAHAIEDFYGRDRSGERNGPRTLDIDIIMVGRRISEDEIELPHPRAHERAFVLVPWLDADPLAELAGHGPVKGLVDSMDTTGVKRRDDIVVTKPERV